jgi:hypothetical protein
VSHTSGVATRLKPVDIGQPRMRGWLHVYAFFIAIAAGIVLVALAATIGGGVRGAVLRGCFQHSDLLLLARVWPFCAHLGLILWLRSESGCDPTRIQAGDSRRS